MVVPDDVDALTWAMFVAIKDAVLSARGVVFGGAVRDMVLHNTAAAGFYAAQRDMTCKDLQDHRYGDARVHPETADRLVLPADVDAVFYSAADLAAFRGALEPLGLRVCFESDPRGQPQYAGHAPAGWRHTKMVVRFDVKPPLRSHVSGLPSYALDVLQPEAGDGEAGPGRDALPPFGAPDFECNSLALVRVHGTEVLAARDRSGDRSGLHVHSEVGRIVADIVARRAVYSSDQVLVRRSRKMLDKGFALRSECAKLMHEPPPDDGEGRACVICHDPLEGTHVKMHCCHACYHPSCLRTVLARCASCPQCRARLLVRASDEAFLGAMEALMEHTAAAATAAAREGEAGEPR